MRVLYHHRTQGTGSESVHIAHIIKELRMLGNDVDVASPTDQDMISSFGDNPCGDRKELGKRVLNAFSRAAPQWLFESAELLYNIPAFFKLRAKLEPRPNLLYERHAHFLFAGAYFASQARCPYFIEVNELVSGQKRLRRRTFVMLARYIERYVFGKASAIIVVSDFIKSKIAEAGIPESKIHVVPNAADERVFHPGVDGARVRESLGIDQDSIVFGYSGWFQAYHSVDLLVSAFASIAKGKNMYLMLVGDGSQRSKLRNQAESAGMLDQVIFAGAVPFSEVPEYLNAMDICVLPGSNNFGSPIKLFEYMIMEKAVVAPALQTTTCVVDDERDGLVFTPGDCEKLAVCLKRLADDAALRRRLSRAARTKILERHLWRHNAERVISIYEQLSS